MLHPGRSYHVTLYVNATAGTTGFVAELVEVAMPLNALAEHRDRRGAGAERHVAGVRRGEGGGARRRGLSGGWAGRGFSSSRR